MFLALTQLRYKYTIAPCQPSAQQIDCHCLLSCFNYHQLAASVDIGVHALASKLDFTLHAMALLIVADFVRLTPIPCSLFYFCPSVASGSTTHFD